MEEIKIEGGPNDTDRIIYKFSRDDDEKNDLQTFHDAAELKEEDNDNAKASSPLSPKKGGKQLQDLIAISKKEHGIVDRPTYFHQAYKQIVEYYDGDSIFLVRFILGILIITLGLASLGLVSAWASPGLQLWLGVPNWNTNIFAWHPVLMVTSLVCQSCAAATFCFVRGSTMVNSNDPNVTGDEDTRKRINSHRLAKLIHFLLQIAALITLVIGLIAITSYKSLDEESSLYSLHSWLGVIAIAFFILNFSIGICMNLNFIVTEDFIHSASDAGFILLKTHHFLIGLFTITSFNVAIVTGIINYQNINGSCSIDYTEAANSTPANPAANYPILSKACKVSNGLGVTIVLNQFFLIVTVALTIYTKVTNATLGTDEKFSKRMLIRSSYNGNVSSEGDQDGDMERKNTKYAYI